jgi:hypothetical protein
MRGCGGASYWDAQGRLLRAATEHDPAPYSHASYGLPAAGNDQGAVELLAARERCACGFLEGTNLYHGDLPARAAARTVAPEQEHEREDRAGLQSTSSRDAETRVRRLVAARGQHHFLQIGQGWLYFAHSMQKTELQLVHFAVMVLSCFLHCMQNPFG